MTSDINNSKISLNDSSEYGFCFACGPKNSSGLNLFFKHKGKGVETSFQFDSRFQGFPNYMHGGIISTILDETMNRAALSQNYWVLTAQMEIKFKQPIVLNEKIYAYGEIKRKIGKLLLIDALDMDFREVKIRRDVNCPLCGDNPSVTELIDYEIFCGISVDSDG